jgi:hypothetical protein
MARAEAATSSAIAAIPLELSAMLMEIIAVKSFRISFLRLQSANAFC